MAVRPSIVAEAEDLERHLGDPSTDGGPFTFAPSLAADEAEAFPSAACEALHGWGYLPHLVPARDGGRLEGLDRLLVLGRVVARRDLTVAIATGQTLLGSLAVWLDGSARQRSRVAELVTAGSAGCLALTEEDHGSDLAANETLATDTGSAAGPRLEGTKWCINNATRGGFLTLLARTHASGGPRGFGVVLVDKARLAPGSFQPLPKLRTHGIRGADISGLRFENAALGPDAIVGKEDQGLDLAFKSLQISRTMCSAFSLGAGDTALRLALRFARSRVLYGAAATAIPAVREGLAHAVGDLILAEALAHVGCRALSVVPGEMSVLSAVVKSVVPALVEDVIGACGVLLGARHYLREGAFAPFQKLRRDHAVVGLFDGSTAVNLCVIAAQLPRLFPMSDDTPANVRSALAGLAVPAETFGWSGLRASNRGRDSLLRSLGPWAEEATSLGPRATLLATRLLAARDALAAEIAAHDDAATDDAASFDRARRYGLLAAGVACLGVWVESRSALPPAVGPVMEMALLRALRRLGDVVPIAAPLDEAVALVSAWTDDNRMLSLVPTRLG